MTIQEFNTTIQLSELPVIIDVWAPWCGPCKTMKPHFDSLAEEFGEKAKVSAINADESGDLVASLGIASIPTVLVYREGKQIARQVGALSGPALRNLFEAAIEGKEVPVVSNTARFIRIAAAALIFGFSEQVEPAWPLWVLAGLIFVSAIHDRCPIIQTLKGLFSRKSNGSAAK